MAITLRIATPADEAALRPLLRASYGVLLDGHYEASELAGILPLVTEPNAMLLSCGTFWLAHDDGVLAGCGGWTALPEEPGAGLPLAAPAAVGTARLRHFATHPAHIRRSVATTIYRECERTARLAGIGRFEVRAAFGSEQFYDRLGFTIDRPIALEVSPGLLLRSTVMTKDLGQHLA